MTDTLWSPDFHHALLQSIIHVLSNAQPSECHILAGLHTGRGIVQLFIDKARASGLDVVVSEKHVGLDGEAVEDSNVGVIASVEEHEMVKRKKAVIVMRCKLHT